jgi:DNA polymerase I
MLYTDTPARIISPGTYPFAPHIGGVYTVGHDFVQSAMASVFERTHDVKADIETFGLGTAARRIKSVAIGDKLHSVVFDPRDPYQEHLARKAFAQARTITFHNSPFDVPNLYLNGLVRLADVAKIVDTLLWARLSDPGERVPKSLEAACDRYLKTGPGGEIARAFKALGLNKVDGFRLFDLDRPIYLQGAASDVLLTAQLEPVIKAAALARITTGHPYGRQGVQGAEADALLWREQRINRVLLARTCRGMRVDFDYLDQYREKNALAVAEAEEALHAAGVKPGDGQSLARVLDERGEIPPNHPRTPKTNKLQMTAKTMSEISSPLARQFIRHGKISKVDSDYLQKCIDLSINGRVHPQTNLLAAATGRASMNEPPLHQFSDRGDEDIDGFRIDSARAILMFDEGDEGTSIDLSQGEPITVANMARDWPIVEAYESGVSDVYTELGVKTGMLPVGTTTAMCEAKTPLGLKLKKIRKVLKIVVLAQLYGEGLAKLTADLGLDPGPYTAVDEDEARWRHDLKIGTIIPRYAAAKAIRDQVYAAWPAVARFVRKLKELSKRNRCLPSVSGRVLMIPSGRFGVETHKGVNYTCQGGQYDLLADAMIRIIEAGLGEAIYLTMHDELIVSTSAAHDIRRILETPAERLTFWAGGRVPILRTDMADLGKSWGERIAA